MDTQGHSTDDLGYAHDGSLINDALDEIADGRFVVVDDVAGTETVGGNYDLRVKAGSEEVDGDHRRADQSELRVDGLAKHHLVSLEGGMGMTADRVADDLSEKHWGKS